MFPAAGVPPLAGEEITNSRPRSMWEVVNEHHLRKNTNSRFKETQAFVIIGELAERNGITRTSVLAGVELRSRSGRTRLMDSQRAIFSGRKIDLI